MTFGHLKTCFHFLWKKIKVPWLCQWRLPSKPHPSAQSLCKSLSNIRGNRGSLWHRRHNRPYRMNCSVAHEEQEAQRCFCACAVWHFYTRRGWGLVKQLRASSPCSSRHGSAQKRRQMNSQPATICWRLCGCVAAVDLLMRWGYCPVQSSTTIHQPCVDKQ